MKKLLFSSILLLIIVKFAPAQSTYFSFMLTPPSASITALGGAGASFHSDDPLSIYYNAANGLNAYEGISAIYANYNEDRLYSEIKLGYDYQYYGLSLTPESYPFKVVLSHQRFDYDIPFEFMIWDEDGGTYETYKINSIQKSVAYNFSIGYKNFDHKIPFNFSAGISIKDVQDALKNETTNMFDENTIMTDFGIISEFPFTFSNIQNLPGYKILLAPSFGVSMQNFGEMYRQTTIVPAEVVEYTDGSYRDTKVTSTGPLPRYFRLGFSVSGRLEHQSGWHIAQFRLVREIGDLLVDSNQSYGDEYSDLFDDIQLIDNFILDNSKNVDIHTGFCISFLDFLRLSYGYDKLNRGKTAGVGLDTDGIFYMLNYISDYPVLQKIPNYFSLSYDYATVNKGYTFAYYSDEEWRSYNTFSIRFKHLESLFQRDKKTFTLPRSMTGLSFLAGINYSSFHDKIFTQRYERKFGIGYNLGFEQEVGPLNINFSWKHKGVVLDNNDYDEGEKKEMALRAGFLSLSALIPLELNPKFALLPGLEIAHAVYEKFELLDIPDLKNATNYSILLCGDTKINNNYSLRCEYSHGLNRMYNTELLNIKNRSLSFYLKYKLK